MINVFLTVLDQPDSPEEFEAVYHKYKRLVYHTALKIVGNASIAEDVLQEVFLYVAKNFSKIHRDSCHELAAYLVSCSRSRSYDQLRKRTEQLLDQEDFDQTDTKPVPEDAAIEAERIEELQRKIEMMKPIYRDTLRLMAMGHSYREIANALSLTEETVRARISRGRKLLWEELSQHEE